MSTAEDFEPTDDCFVIDSDEEEIPLYQQTRTPPRNFRARVCEKLSKLFVRKKPEYYNVFNRSEL